MSINPILPRDRQDWETMTPAPISMQGGGFIVSSQLKSLQYTMYFRANNSWCVYNPYGDGYYFPFYGFPVTSNTTGGSAGCWVYNVPYPIVSVTDAISSKLSDTEFIIDLNSTSFPKALTPQQKVEGLPGLEYTFLQGDNKGARRRIIAAELQADQISCKITIERPFQDTAAVTTYASWGKVMTGHIVVFINNGTITAGNLSLWNPDFDNGSNSIGGLNLPAGMTTNCTLLSTPSLNGPYRTGSVTSATSNTLVDSSASFGVAFYKDYQVRIISGSGEGQTFTILDNTADTLTISGSWNVLPTGSKYGIESNDDYLYLGTGTTNTLYRYKFSTRTWDSGTLAGIGVASSQLAWYDRTNLPSASFNYIQSAADGRNLFLFTGGNSENVTQVGISVFTSPGLVSNANRTEPKGTGTSVTHDLNDGTIYYELANSGRIYQYAPYQGSTVTFATPVDTYGQSTATIGNRLFIIYSKDRKGDYIKYLYHVHSSTNVVRRLRLS